MQDLVHMQGAVNLPQVRRKKTMFVAMEFSPGLTNRLKSCLNMCFIANFMLTH
jgi:hypothetical protein